MKSAKVTKKYEESVIFQRRNPVRNHFVNTSKVLLYGYKNLSDNAKITYQIIDGFDWEDKETGASKGYAYPATETLAAIRGVSKRTIERHITELEQVGLLSRQQRRNLPSILIIEDVSDTEIGEYLKQVQRGPHGTQPANKRKVNHQGKDEGQPSEATKVTSDINVVSTEGSGTTKTSFAYSEERKRSEEQQQVVADLKAQGVGEQKAIAVVRAHTTDFIKQKLAFLHWKQEDQAKRGAIHDPAAWLLRAIEEDFQAPPDVQNRVSPKRKEIVTIDDKEGVVIINERTSYSAVAS